MNPPILSKPDLSNAQAGLYQCGQTEQLIAAAKACGLDCQEPEIRNQAHRQFFQGVLDHFQRQNSPPASQ